VGITKEKNTPDGRRAADPAKRLSDNGKHQRYSRKDSDKRPARWMNGNEDVVEKIGRQDRPRLPLEVCQ
jgi:hypothetical protein